MSLESWDPQWQLEQFRRRSNEMWDELLVNWPASESHDEPIAFIPEVDLVESPQEFRFYLSVPGLVEDDIVIDVVGRSLTIRGERRPPYDPDRRDTNLKEWRYGFFERHFELSSGISVTNIRATYDAGVLTVVAEKLKSGLPGTGRGVGDERESQR